MVEVTKPSQVYLFREVEPYLDRLFPMWKLVELRGGNYQHDRAVLTLSTPSQVVWMVRDHDEDTVSFAPDEGYQKQGVTLNVPYLQWILREGLQRQSVSDQLGWLEMHYAWREQWQHRATYDQFVRAQEVRGRLFAEFASEYWRGPGIRPRSEIAYPAMADDSALGSSLLYRRASGYFPILLGPGWRVEERGGALIVSGNRMSLRIHTEQREEVVSVGPSAGGLQEWLEVGEINQAFEREELGRSLETKLANLVRSRESYEFMCRPERFPQVAELLKRAEVADAEVIRILTGEALQH
jgi:hypothetical protein